MPDKSKDETRKDIRQKRLKPTAHVKGRIAEEIKHSEGILVALKNSAHIRHLQASFTLGGSKANTEANRKKESLLLDVKKEEAKLKKLKEEGVITKGVWD